MVWRVISSIMAVCARRVSAAAMPRAALEQLFAALSHMLIHGFFMKGQRRMQHVVPSGATLEAKKASCFR